MFGSFPNVINTDLKKKKETESDEDRQEVSQQCLSNAPPLPPLVFMSSCQRLQGHTACK